MPGKKAPEDSWETQSGLPDDFDFFITNAYFGFREEYQNGEAALLIWEGESPDEEVESIIWPIGKGWEVTNKGANVQHPRRTKFITSSMIGRLIERVVKELKVDMRSRGTHTEAKPWIGLGFHMRREELSFGEGILEERGGKTTHLMPVSVLKGGKAAAKSGKSAPAEQEEENEAPAAVDNKALVDKLALLAKSLTQQKFQTTAMNMAGVSEDGDLLADVLNDSDTGFWSRYHK